MFCTNCGSKLADNIKFCPHCGTPVEPVEANAPVPSAPVVPTPEPGTITVEATPVTTAAPSMPDYPMTLNGVTFNAVELALETKFFEATGFSKDQKMIDKLREVTKAGIWKASNFALKMRENETLKTLVTTYQSGMPVQVTLQYEDGQLRCPQCNSTHIVIDKSGFSATKAIVGGILTGGIGVLAGLHGRNRRVGKCLKCGHHWDLN